MTKVIKTLTGIVSSDARDKTITVKIEKYEKHPMYGKRVKKTKKFHAHDAKNEAKIGDKVLITETRPLSTTKRWTLDKILEKAVILHKG